MVTVPLGNSLIHFRFSGNSVRFSGISLGNSCLFLHLEPSQSVASPELLTETALLGEQLDLCKTHIPRFSVDIPDRLSQHQAEVDLEAGSCQEVIEAEKEGGEDSKDRKGCSSSLEIEDPIKEQGTSIAPLLLRRLITQHLHPKMCILSKHTCKMVPNETGPHNQSTFRSQQPINTSYIRPSLVCRGSSCWESMTHSWRSCPG